jgi:hypothetical protein
MVKSAKDVMSGSRKWTGTTAFTIAQNCSVHWKAFIALGEASDHVPVQIPDERTRGTNLMDSFETIDPTVLAALSPVRQDEVIKRVNFEASVSFLIQSCPVVAKQKKMLVNSACAPAPYQFSRIDPLAVSMTQPTEHLYRLPECR